MQTELSSLGTWKRFGLDVAASRKVIFSAPAIPLVSGVLGAVGILIGTGSGSDGNVILQLFYVPHLIIWCGWVGVERIFFLQRFRGEKLRLSRSPALVLRFIPRYLLLFVMLSVPLVVLLSTQFITSSSFAAPILFLGPWLSLVLLVPALIVLMTFVTPALAYSTKSTFRGLALGVRFLRDRWGQCKLYALFPILIWLVVILLSAGARSFGLLTQLGAGVVSVYLILLLKGATARFYIAEIKHDITSEGAAFVGARDPEIVQASRAPIQTVGWLRFVELGLLAAGLGIALLWPTTIGVHETFESGAVASGAVRCGGPVRTLLFGPKPEFVQLLDGIQSIESYRRVEDECSRRAVVPLVIGVSTATVGIVLYILVGKRGNRSSEFRVESPGIGP